MPRGHSLSQRNDPEAEHDERGDEREEDRSSHRKDLFFSSDRELGTAVPNGDADHEGDDCQRGSHHRLRALCCATDRNDRCERNPPPLWLSG